MKKPVQRIQLRGNRTDEMEVQNGTRNRQIVGSLKKNVYFISFWGGGKLRELCRSSAATNLLNHWPAALIRISSLF